MSGSGVGRPDGAPGAAFALAGDDVLNVANDLLSLSNMSGGGE